MAGTLGTTAKVLRRRQKLQSSVQLDVSGRWSNHVLNICVDLVDDSSLAGSADLRMAYSNGFRENIRKHFKLDPEIKNEDGAGARVLGRHHTIHRSPSQTAFTSDMHAYAEQVARVRS